MKLGYLYNALKPMQRRKILLVEDDQEVASFINTGLTEAGYDVTVCNDGTSGYQSTTSSTFDLLILDVMLPGMSGLDICRSVRRQNKVVGILLLTALGNAENIVQGLESEADDYLVKPFKFVELLARIKSILRRAESTQQQSQNAEEIYQVADLEVNDYRKTVKRDGQLIPVTSTEYRLLLLMIRNPGRVYSRHEILEQVWDVNFNINTNVVDVYVNYLRKKIDRDKPVKLIHTVIGMGYVLKVAG